ncbi:MAG: kinase/pyrophosphorylase [Nevskiaceae bacterium]|nr:MAG: kinase/pyrophosphorylase [Nevskiaceae bacterium]TBR74024.1 MAG: kinase/pyrophosphorylase [Nevskiaceae bacterium]
MAVQRDVFFLSDGTGITAETLGNALLTQFEGCTFEKTTLPFIHSVERAHSVVEYLRQVEKTSGERPIVFSTTTSNAIRDELRAAPVLFIDLFDSMLPAIEAELGVKSTHAQGRAHSLADGNRYDARMAAVNYAMEHDDGQSVRDLPRADVVLIAPSRCGKTPTSIYLALQYGIFAANFPLTEDDLTELRLPRSIATYSGKLFGLTSAIERLHEVRSERRPGSTYSSVSQCAFELRQAEQLYRRHGIPYVNSEHMSVEEIAATVMQERGLRRTA